MCMSLEGFVAQPDDNPAELFDWYWGGDVVVPSAQEGMSFSVDAASAPMLAELTSGCGAVVAGRRLFDQTDGWGDNHPAGAPVVVVTHRPPPDDAAKRFPRTTFNASVEEALTTARRIAGEQFVTIASADIIQQALNLSLVDEVCVSWCRYCSVRASATSWSSSADMSYLKTRSLSKVPGRSTSATRCDADDADDQVRADPRRRRRGLVLEPRRRAPANRQT